MGSIKSHIIYTILSDHTKQSWPSFSIVYDLHREFLWMASTIFSTVIALHSSLSNNNLCSRNILNAIFCGSRRLYKYIANHNATVSCRHIIEFATQPKKKLLIKWTRVKMGMFSLTIQWRKSTEKFQLKCTHAAFQCWVFSSPMHTTSANGK